MNAAGVGLLAGTDTPLGSLPGFALHTELELLVRAGLSPAEALRAATLARAHLDTTTRNCLPLRASNEWGEGHTIKVASSPQPSPPVGSGQERENISIG